MRNKTHRRGFVSRLAAKLPVIVLLVGAFFLGINVGNGRIVLSKTASTNKNLPADLNYGSVEEVYDDLKSDFDGKLDTTQLLDGLKAGLAKSTTDPYTVYMNAKEAKDFNEELSGSFEGIGAELGKDDKKNVIIVAPIVGTPAEKAGLKAKDIIATINGKSAYDITVEEAKNQIRGAKGTTVKLKIVRGTDVIDVEITRDTITLPNVTTEIKDGIGYMQILRFAPDTAGLAAKAATSFKEANVKGVVVDLRSNPGGLLDSSVSIASLWLPKGKTIVSEKHGGVTVQGYKSTGETTLNGIPTVVLIDEGSASASEILAGALKDNGAAKLVGVKSFGKGSVQELLNLRSGGVLKVTIARWFTPNGVNIDKEGIKPDQEVKRTDDDVKAGKDPQKDAAIELLKK